MTAEQKRGELKVGTDLVVHCKATCGRCGVGLLFTAKDKADAKQHLTRSGRREMYYSRKYGWCCVEHKRKRKYIYADSFYL